MDERKGLKKKMICFKCGKKGHSARECTQKYLSRCRLCKKTHHTNAHEAHKLLSGRKTETISKYGSDDEEVPVNKIITADHLDVGGYEDFCKIDNHVHKGVVKYRDSDYDNMSHSNGSSSDESVDKSNKERLVYSKLAKVKEDDGFERDILCDVATIKDKDIIYKRSSDEEDEVKKDRKTKRDKIIIKKESTDEDEVIKNEIKRKRIERKVIKRVEIEVVDNDILSLSNNLIVIFYNLIRCISITLFNCLSTIIYKSMLALFNVVNKSYKFIIKKKEDKTLQATDIKEEEDADLSNDDQKEYSYDSEYKDE
jgi:hypothetical protein